MNKIRCIDQKRIVSECKQFLADVAKQCSINEVKLAKLDLLQDLLACFDEVLLGSVESNTSAADKKIDRLHNIIDAIEASHIWPSLFW